MCVGCNSQAQILACPPPSPLKRLGVYPNPTDGIVNVAFDPIKSYALLEIRNGFGQMLFATALEVGTDRLSTNVGNGQFTNGVYFVSFLEMGKEQPGG